MPRVPSPDALAYRLEDAAEIAGLSSQAIYRAIKSGELRAKRTSRSEDGEPPKGRILVLRKDLEAWLENLDDDWWGARY